MSLTKEFSTPAVHELVYADDFCPFAMEIREELLRHPAWTEMTQDSRDDAVSQSRTDRQNGITTGHLGDQQRAALPHSLAFRDFTRLHATALASRIGVDIGPTPEIEMNAMAYGEGSWLSPHTDYRPDEARPRVIAWMLYLTHPEDHEWSTGMGGAVRLFEQQHQGIGDLAHGKETRVLPRFNRFAMFKVSDVSLHEIEKVGWPCAWDRCRLALSGWFRGSDDSRPRAARLYVRRPDAGHIRARREARLCGAIAMYRLLRQQRAYSGQPCGDLDSLLRHYEDEHEWQATAPTGTAFLRHAPGPAWCIIVVDEVGQVVYFGPRNGYAVS